MQRREWIAHLAQSREEEILLARVSEKIELAQQRNVAASSCFLSKREQALLQSVLGPTQYQFFGGCNDAERMVCCYLPEYLDENWLYEEDGPIAAVHAEFYESNALTHRDVLGSLMGSGIKRETVGDIYVHETFCEFFVTKEILPYVLQNVNSAGRSHLHLSQIDLLSVQGPEQKIKAIRDTVSSLRLDAVVSSGFGLSRAKAAAAIEAGKTELNYFVCMKADKQVDQSDVISIRGLGKIRLEEISGTTKKGRIGIIISRFL